MDNPLLSVRDLNVMFNLRGKRLHAIRDVSLDIYKGESLAIVGESGSGKSVFVKTFMGLNDANGWIDSGEIVYNGVKLTDFTREAQWLEIRGGEIAMVMQDPMTSLNPLKTVGAQIEEAIVLHQKLGSAEARAKAVELLSKPADKTGFSQEAYYEGIAGNPTAAIVKAIDRCNNVSNMMASFTIEKVIEYVDETEAYVLPLLDTIKHEYPEYHDACFVIKYQIYSTVESVKAAVMRL